ncbi:DNA-directed RNA polymerase III subunit RPC5 [Stigmatopora argus]
MASGDDDDPIIEEIDVYLAKSLAEKLYLLQYPVRPSNMTYDDVNLLAAKIKPKQQRVELQMSMDTNSPNYCRSKGEQIALNVDGRGYEENNTYSVKMMDNQTFSSIQATTSTSRYAAAIFRKGELHITPLAGILQMRPSFAYLDKADSKTKEREAGNEGGDSSQDEAEDEAKAISVRFSRPETEQARQRRIQSYDFLQKKQAEEPWIHLQYHSLRDSRSEHERQYLFCQHVDSSDNSELVKTPKEYLSMLMPPLAEEKVIKPVGPSNVLSMAQLRTLPIGEQIKTLMKNVKVIQFASLMGLLASGTDATAVLRCIQQVALLVQGNWVVKSDILYPKNSCSPHSGVPADVLCRGRDFVMWRFTLERSLMRKEITAMIKLPPEDVKDFLEQVAVPRVNRGWEFLLPADVEFVKRHADVAQRQQMLWLGIQSKLEKVFKFSKDDFMPKNSQLPEAVHISGTQRLKMAQDRAQEKQASLQKDLHAKKASSGGGVRVKKEPLSDGEAEPMDTSAPPPSSSGLTNGSLNGYPGGQRANGNGGSPANAPSPPLLDFVSATFGKNPVLTFNELKRLFSLHLATMPAGHIPFGPVSDHMLQDAVLLSRCRQIVVPFPALTSASADQQKVFGLWETGEDFDKHRHMLFEMFTKNYRLKRSTVQARLSEELGEVSKADMDRLHKECCSSHGGMWYLKGTVPS